MSLPSDFNPATFLYLNPEFQAYSNVTTIEQARDYYGSNGGDFMYSLSNLPAKFDSRIFISDNKDGINISGLNRTIKLAMSNDGYTPYDLDVFANYLPTIYKNVQLVDSNIFSFSDLNYQITLSNLIVGDDIQIETDNTNYAYANVIEIDPSTSSFTVSNYYSDTYSNMSSSYLLVGHKIYDFERLARVNWARNNRSSNPIYGDFSNRYYGLDPDFNVELYQLLYPDARTMTADQCILDYTARRNNSDIRIGKSGEIVSEIAFIFTDLLNLDVSCNCKVDGNLIVDGYWVDGITNDYVRTSDIASSTMLITEKASKRYLDNMLKGTMILNNLIVDSNTTLCNEVDMLGNASIVGTFTACSDVNVEGTGYFNQATISNNLAVMGTSTFTGDQILLGNGGVWGSMHIHNDAFAASNLSLSNNLNVMCNINMGGIANLSNIFTSGSADINTMTIANDIQVEGNGFFQNTLTVVNVSVIDGIVVDSNAQIQGDLHVTGDLNVSSDFNVLSNSVFFGYTFMNAPATLCNTLLVNGDSTFSNVGIRGFTVFASDVSLSNDLIVQGDAIFQNALTVANVSVTDGIVVDSNAQIHGDLQVTGDLNVSSDFNVLSNSVFFGNTFMNAQVTLCNSLNVLETTFALGGLQSYGTTCVNDSLNVIGTANFGCNVHVPTLSVTSNATFDGSFISYGDTTFLGSTRFADDVEMESNLSLNSVLVNGMVTIGNSNTYGQLVLDAKGSIRCDEYLLTSDQRVKDDISTLDTDVCCKIIQSSPLISYCLQYDAKRRTKYGFLAHDIENLDGNVVTNIVDYIPDIMHHAIVKKSTVYLKNHSVKAGNKLKVFNTQTHHIVVMVLSVRKMSFKIDTDKLDGQRVFIYGTEIPDFKTIDYTQMFAVAVGALQKTMEKVSKLESQVSQLMCR